MTALVDAQTPYFFLSVLGALWPGVRFRTGLVEEGEEVEEAVLEIVLPHLYGSCRDLTLAHLAVDVGLDHQLRLLLLQRPFQPFQSHNLLLSLQLQLPQRRLHTDRRLRFLHELYHDHALFEVVPFCVHPLTLTTWFLIQGDVQQQIPPKCNVTCRVDLFLIISDVLAVQIEHRLPYSISVLHEELWGILVSNLPESNQRAVYLLKLSE